MVDLKVLSNPVDIQAQIDRELDRRGVRAYVEYMRYVPQGQEPPADASHVLSLRSARTGEAVVVALKVPGFYGLLADAALAIL